MNTKNLFILPLLLLLLIGTACNKGICDLGEECPLTFDLTDEPPSCCFESEHLYTQVRYYDRLVLDLNKDGNDDLEIDGQHLWSSSSNTYRVWIETLNGTKVSTAGSDELKTFTWDDELNLASVEWNSIRLMAVESNGTTGANNWPSETGRILPFRVASLDGSFTFGYLVASATVGSAENTTVTVTSVITRKATAEE